MAFPARHRLRKLQRSSSLQMRSPSWESAQRLIASGVPAVLLGTTFAYIWLSTRNLAVAAVYHSAHNSVRDSIAVTVGLGDLTGRSANPSATVLGTAPLLMGRWRGPEAG